MRKASVAVLCVVLGVLPSSAGDESCRYDGATQVEKVLEKSTNRILLAEIIEQGGEAGRAVLLRIAADREHPLRGRAVSELGEHRFDAAEQLLFDLLEHGDAGFRCLVISALEEYRNPALIPRLIGFLNDQRTCSELLSISVGEGVKARADMLVADYAVAALEKLTGRRFEEEPKFFEGQHRATSSWQQWWTQSQQAFGENPHSFLADEKERFGGDKDYGCSVDTIAVSPDGQQAFSAGKSYDPWFRLWDIGTRRQVWASPTFAGDEINHSVYSPDGRIIALASRHDAIKLLDATTGDRFHTIIVGDSISFLTFSPDGHRLAATTTREIVLYTSGSWCEEQRLENEEYTTGIAFSPDGSLLATATFGKVRIWDLARSVVIAELAVRPGPRPTAFADHGEREAGLWKMAWRVAFSPDGRLLAGGGSAAVHVWDVATWKEIASAESKGDVESLAFTPDGVFVVWGNDNDEIFRWDFLKKRTRRIRNESSMGDLALVPHTNLALSPASGTDINVYDLGKGNKVGVLRCTKALQKQTATR